MQKLYKEQMIVRVELGESELSHSCRAPGGNRNLAQRSQQEDGIVVSSTRSFCIVQESKTSRPTMEVEQIEFTIHT